MRATPNPAALHRRPTDDDAATIEPADLEDAPLLRALAELSLVALADERYEPAQIDGLLATRDVAPADMLAAGRMLIARRRGFVVGCAGWEPFGDAGRPAARIRSVFVHPLQTRRGVASSLVRAVEAQAAARGLRRFSLAATLNAAPLYDRLGYARISDAALHVGGGLAFPVALMERVVDAPAAPIAFEPTTSEE